MALNNKHDAHIRAAQALDLRMGGATYRQIAERLGYKGPSGALQAVRLALHEHAAEPATQVRDLEAARLDRLMMSLWPTATSMTAPHAERMAAIDRVIKLMDRRAALLGLDAPRKVDLGAWIADMAMREGLDPEQAVADAQDIIRSANW